MLEVFSRNKLIGYCKVKILDSVEYTLVNFIKSLKLRPSNLIYTLNKFYLNDKKYNYDKWLISRFKHFLIKKFSFKLGISIYREKCIEWINRII